MSDEPTDPFARHIRPSGGELPPLTRPEPPTSDSPDRRIPALRALVTLSLALNVLALVLVAVLLIQPGALGLAKTSKVTSVEKQVEATPSLADLRSELAAIRRGPPGARGPRGDTGPPGPAGTVDGFDLDDLESRVSDIESADPDSRLSQLEGIDSDSRLSDLESFRDDLCSAFSTAGAPIEDLYYYGPC